MFLRTEEKKEIRTKWVRISSFLFVFLVFSEHKLKTVFKSITKHAQGPARAGYENLYIITGGYNQVHWHLTIIPSSAGHGISGGWSGFGHLLNSGPKLTCLPSVIIRFLK